MNKYELKDFKKAENNQERIFQVLVAIANELDKINEKLFELKK